MELKPNGFERRHDVLAFAHLSVESLFTDLRGRRVLSDVSLEIANVASVRRMIGNLQGKTSVYS